MITSQYCVVMAEYNAWMNAKMYALCETLLDVDRKKDLGAFFRSIHGTLNHILACDLMFLASFTKNAAFVECEGDLHDHFTDLRQDRARVDSRLLKWSREVSPEWLAASSTYTHYEDGVARTVTQAFWVVHIRPICTCQCRFPMQAPSPSIERAFQRPLRALWPTAHVER
jgi:uncharacterized damage-inducible protein DinB